VKIEVYSAVRDQYSDKLILRLNTVPGMLWSLFASADNYEVRGRSGDWFIYQKNCQLYTKYRPWAAFANALDAVHAELRKTRPSLFM